MLQTLEQKKKYIQATRLQNYQASLKLEGIQLSSTAPTLDKAQILEKYKKFSQTSESWSACLMDKYGEMGDSIYCYPNSDVLKNNLNIQDAEILQQAELELTQYTSTRIEYAEPPYDLKYLQAIHFQLFSDLYTWAGEQRQVDIAKGDTRFCTFTRIEVEANKLFKQLQQENYFQGLAKPVLIQKIADFLLWT